MKKKVLVIDDDVAILDAMKTLLEEEAFDVRTISSPFKAKEEVADYKPDVILLDILLSGEDGRNIAKQLKATENTRHIPIILLSAHSGIEKSLNDTSVDAFIPKPFDIDHLLEKIKEFAY